MSNEYTPTLQEVRENYGWNGHDSYIESNREASKAQFDRFIERYRAEAKSEALKEAAQDLFDWAESPFMCLDSCGDNTCPDDIRLGAGKDIQTWLRNRAEQLKESK